jgi:hypothetical protein
MSLVNTNVVDLAGGTVTFDSLSGVTAVENITYDQSSNNIVFSIIPGISLSGTDFITLLNQITIFQTAIVYNFSPGSAFITPFTSFVSNEHYISFTNAWSLTCNESSGPSIISYYGTQSNSQIDISERANPITIPFSEWVVLLASLNHYRQSITAFFGI